MVKLKYSNKMYKFSPNQRKYSTTPIVKVLENGTEIPIAIILLPKNEGNELTQRIIDLLNLDDKKDILLLDKIEKELYP